VYSLGGLLRHQMREQQRQQQQASAKRSSGAGYSANILEELNRDETLLLMALRPVCVYDVSDPTDERALIPHQVSLPPYPPIVLQTLSHSYSVQFQQLQQQQQQQPSPGRAETLFALAVFTDRASALYAQYYHLKVRELSNPEISFSIAVTEADPVTGELYGFYKQMKDSLVTSLQFYKDAGEVLPCSRPSPHLTPWRLSSKPTSFRSPRDALREFLRLARVILR
jgi:hypothetical protein